LPGELISLMDLAAAGGAGVAARRRQIFRRAGYRRKSQSQNQHRKKFFHGSLQGTKGNRYGRILIHLRSVTDAGLFTFSGIRTSKEFPVVLPPDGFVRIEHAFSRTIGIRDTGMPRFRPTAKLERSALADLCKHTLSRIPTVSGRLIYLATLRDLNSGTYRHHGLITTFGRDEAIRALRESHQAAFQTWLNLPLAEKNEDLRSYLMALDDSQEEIVEHWLRSGVYRSYVPASAITAETSLFCADLETLLQLLRNDAIRRQSRSGDDVRDQGSSLPG